MRQCGAAITAARTGCARTVLFTAAVISSWEPRDRIDSTSVARGSLHPLICRSRDFKVAFERYSWWMIVLMNRLSIDLYWTSLSTAFCCLVHDIIWCFFYAAILWGVFVWKWCFLVGSDPDESKEKVGWWWCFDQTAFCGYFKWKCIFTWYKAQFFTWKQMTIFYTKAYYAKARIPRVPTI